MADKLTTLDFTFGLPPSSYTSGVLIKNSMPTVIITPCQAEPKANLQLYSLTPIFKNYNKRLQEYGFTFPTGATEGGKQNFTVAYQADSFPTDNFSNEYGESFMDKFSQVASGGFSDINQFFGTRKVTDFLGKISGVAGEGSLIGGAANFGKEAVENTKSFLRNMGGKGYGSANSVEKMIKSLDATLAGARIDFPKVWKNSSFEPSYTMTVRLYNPSPGNPELTRKYIVGPIAALLLLGLPQSDAETGAYLWPYLCKITSPGIFDINAAFISSISVIKGGDQQAIAWNQVLSVVDVRIDFASLYRSIVIEASPGSAGKSRPTLKTYLDVIGNSNENSVKDLYKMYDVPTSESTKPQTRSELSLMERGKGPSFETLERANVAFQSPDVSVPASRRSSDSEIEKERDLGVPAWWNI